MESQFDPGEGPVADLPSDLVEAHPAADDQLLDGLLVFAHGHGEFLQGGEERRAVAPLLLMAAVWALRQAVEAVAESGARQLVLASRHLYQTETGAVSLGHR